MSASGSASGSSTPPQDKVQKFNVKIPVKNNKKTYHIMKFNSSLKVDVPQWKQVRMVRENNRKDFRHAGDDEPKFGAGSEFGRKEREEARRKKYGMVSRKYKPEDQPWLMRVGSKKEGKQYRGLREGGVAENTTYYVFTHAADGSFEAHPVSQWYHFKPRVNYKTLSAEEAEEQFMQRGQILNHFAVMVNRKLRPEGDADADADGAAEGSSKKKKGAKGEGGMKISDMDDWIESGDDDLDTDEDKADDSDDGKKKNSRSKDSKKKKKKKEEADLEGLEDSDDGDDEGREVDYMSDESSDSEDELLEKANQKGVDQDEGLAKMLDSDSSSDEDEKDSDDDDEEDDDKSKKKKKGADADGSDDEKEKGGKKSKAGSKNSSRAATPTPDGSEEKSNRAEKRKALVDSLLDPNAAEPSAKKSRLEAFGAAPSSSSSASGNSVESAFEEDVRRYLARKPMTTTEILKKIKSKKTGLAKDELMPLLVNVLKKINPHKQKVKGIMYLSLKTGK